MNSSHNLQVYTKTRNAISSLLVNQLKQVLREEGLTIGGTKTVLIDRVEKQLAHYFNSNDVTRLNRLTFLILQPHGSAPTQASPTYTPSYQAHGSNSAPMMAAPSSSSYGTPPSWHKFPTGNSNVQLNFKESPFYKTATPLSSVHTLKVVEAGRATHEFSCKLPPEWATRFDRDAPDRELYKILLFGACDPASSFMKLDVAFPSQFEVKINGTEVRSNWKGLKNKTGTTRPADVTEYLRKTNNYDNTVTVTWALTNKKYYVRLDLVKQTTLDSMIQKLREGKTISKAQVLRDMANKAKDSDIVATSTVMSLKCPLSYMRLRDPCRGNLCGHNQCFDAMSYLQLQQQAPTWLCPICNRIATYENLQIDQYVADILRSVSEDVEQVNITPEGEWSQVNPDSNNRESTGVRSKQESVEDLDDISDSPSQQAFMSFGPSKTHTPTPVKAPEPVSANNSVWNSNNKRSHDVVDLTLDSSEDESPAPKRMSIPVLKLPVHLSSSRPQNSTSPMVQSPLSSGRSYSASQGPSMPLSRSFGPMQG